MPLKNLWIVISSTCCSTNSFYRPVKTNNLGKRTIDEGSMDEKSGMNFSEYVAILSGNTDLLDKAKLKNRLPDWKAKSRRLTVLNTVLN
jgi:hypothetical protein